jgi:hypothetical protein
MKQLILFIISFMLIWRADAQDQCEVKLKEISGTYTGECSNGKAHGAGKANGIDEYQGQFKNGYPEGKGMYTWKDGHYFIGYFKKGRKEGKGDMYYESSKGEDSVVSGFWKKDEYAGLYESPFEMTNPSSKIGRVEGRQISRKGTTITFNVHQMSNFSTNVGNGSIVGQIAFETVLLGTFETKNTQNMSNSSLTRYQQVRFPFKVRITFAGNQTADFEFHEPGDYDVSVNLSL